MHSFNCIAPHLRDAPSSYAPHCALQTTVLLVASLKHPRKFGFQKHKSLKPAIASAIFSRFQAQSLILWRNDDLLLQQRCDLLLVSGEGGVDHVVHVVVLVSAEAAANTVFGSALALASYWAYRALSASVLTG